MEKLKNNETIGQQNLLSLQSLHHICDSKLFENLSYNASKNISTSSIVESLDKISNSFTHLSEFRFLPWNKEWKSFDGGFHKLMTEEGICYTINMIRHEDMYRNTMNPSLRYPKHNLNSSWSGSKYSEMSLHAYPYRILGDSASLKLKLKMRKQDVNYACKGPANGFRLTLTSPHGLPRPSLQFYRIPFNTETLISVKPRGMITSKNLKSYEVKQRQCYFGREKRLKFFKMYSQSNCQLECLSSMLKCFK